MRIRAIVTVSLLMTSTVACGALVGIRDLSDATEDTDAGRLDAGASESSTPDSAKSDVSAPDANPDTSVPDAGPVIVTGGEAHFLQSGDSVVLEYTSKASGEKKELTVAANGPFALPEQANAARVKTSAAGKKCWLRVEASAIDLRCLLSAGVDVAATTTDSASFTAVPGAKFSFTTDLPKSDVLVVYSMPYLTTSGPEVNYPNYATTYVRAIVDGDASKSIDLTRMSTFWHQPWNQSLIGTLEVGPGTHEVVIEAMELQPTVVAGRVSMIGGTLDGGGGRTASFGSSLSVVALQSMETFRSVQTTRVTGELVIPKVDKDKWISVSTLAGTAASPSKALLTGYYPEVSVTSPGSGSAAWFSLVSGTQSLVAHDFFHLQDEGGVRSVGLVTSASVTGAYSFGVEQRTPLGPTRVAPGQGAGARMGGGLSAMLFSDTSDLQTWSFSGDADFNGAIDTWQNVASSKAVVKAKGKALVFASVNRVSNTTSGGASEIGLFDGTQPVVRGATQSWSFEYGMGCILATVVDFSAPGTHELELRVRRLNNGVPLVRHASTPDFRGVSSITVLPLE